MSEIPETRYARTPDGGFIAYKVIGDGPIDLALVNSVESQIEVFFEYEPVARFWLDLASSARVIVHDRRGTGLSDTGEGLPNLETRAADLRAVLDAVGSTRAFLFGIDDGGSVAALHAATFPDRVAGLLWYVAAARSVQAPDWPYGATSEEVDEFVQEIASDWGTTDSVRRNFFDYWGIPADEECIRWLAKMQRAFCGPETAQRNFRLVCESDVRALLPTLRVPTLVLDVDYGEERWNGASEATAALIPGAEFRRLPGTHFHFDDAEHRLAIIRDFLGIQRPPPVLDRVLATVLFTDIVDSTSTASRLGDPEWHRLLEKHDRVATEAVERYRGQVVKSTGDGILATFDGPARAVFAAREISERVDPLGLRIRAGAHTGEIELGGNDVHGVAVHIGARVAALAGPADVLVSSTVKDLVAGSGLSFEDAGEHELKGVPDLWHLYRVVD